VDVPGSTLASDCIQCPAGKKVSEASGGCIACPVSKYSTGITSAPPVISMVGSVDFAVDRKWNGGVLGLDKKVYGIPFNAAEVLVIDTIEGTTDISMGGLTGEMKWSGGVLAQNKKIYGIPHNAEQVLIIDTADDTTSVTSLMGVPDRAEKWIGGVLGPDKKI
jgi:hypothetical protein